MPQNRLVDIMEKRILKEKDFHNNKIVRNTRAATKKYYSITANCMDKRVLEYGCGTGSLAFKLAEHRSEQALDRSPATDYAV